MKRDIQQLPALLSYFVGGNRINNPFLSHFFSENKTAENQQ